MSERSGNDSGSASVLGFLVGTLVFLTGFTTVAKVTVQHESSVATDQQGDRSFDASRLADLLITEPGTGWFSDGYTCINGRPDPQAVTGDDVQRVGLGEEGCSGNGPAGMPNLLNFDKMYNLYRAAEGADPSNGFVDYEEARNGLGLLETNTNFHLRTWPVLPSVESLLREGKQDPYARPLYIGDYEEWGAGQPQTYLVQHSADFVDVGDCVNLRVSVTNNGTTATAFSVTFRVPTPTEIVVEKHTPRLAPDANATVKFPICRSSDWAWSDPADPHFGFTIRDPSKTVGEGRFELDGLGMSAASAVTTPFIQSMQLETQTDGQGYAKLKVSYDAVQGDGNSNVNGPDWVMDLKDENDVLLETKTGLKPKGGTETFDVDAPGDHTVSLREATDELDDDGAIITDTDLDRFTPGGIAGEWRPEPPVEPEGRYIATVVENFDFGVMGADFDHPDVPYLGTGDIMPDDNRFLADNLPALLLDENDQGTTQTYNILFVGSAVDHKSMTSGAIKWTIEKWVLAGGALVVFGSDEQAVQWLQPIFHASIDAAGDGLYTPDQNHPLLRTPHQLDHQAFDADGKAWKYSREEDRTHFTHVVTDGSEDVLAVSNPGALGAGRVILTSWQPWKLQEGGDPPGCGLDALEPTCPGIQLVGNFLTISYTGLYLDYGPQLPDDKPIGATTRVALVYHPELMEFVEVHLVVFVF